jgi:hypothetical protein
MKRTTSVLMGLALCVSGSVFADMHADTSPSTVRWVFDTRA